MCSCGNVLLSLLKKIFSFKVANDQLSFLRDLRNWMQYSNFGAKSYSDICPRTLFIPLSKHFEEIFELWGTDNVQRKISEHIFSSNPVPLPDLYFDSFSYPVASILGFHVTSQALLKSVSAMLVSLGCQIYANNSLFLQWCFSIIAYYFANYRNIQG